MDDHYHPHQNHGSNKKHPFITEPNPEVVHARMSTTHNRVAYFAFGYRVEGIRGISNTLGRSTVSSEPRLLPRGLQDLSI